MAAVHGNSIVALCAVFQLVLFVGSSQGLVHELNKAKFAKFIQGKLFTLTFVDAPSCRRCSIAFPFFLAASQAFPHDPEIFFTRTNDKALIKEWEITELPALVYHRAGKKDHELVQVDIKVDDIINEISRILGGNFGGLTRIYTIELNDNNYHDIIVAPKQSVLMLVHDKGDASEREVIEKVAYTFRNDDAVICLKLDVVKHRKLRDEIILSRDTPAMIWFPPDEKTSPKRFGGVLSHELLTLFVNERTELNRNMNGTLNPKAGRVEAADELLEDNIATIMDGAPEDIKSVISSIEGLLDKVEWQHVEMLEYYIYILENIAAASGEKTVKEILEGVDRRLSEKEGATTSQKDTLTRKRNIVKHFLNLETKFSTELPQEDKDPGTAEPRRKDARRTSEHEDRHGEL